MFLHGVAAATGCTVGHRMMRIVDEGEVAVTFVDTVTEHAVRIWPRAEARHEALAYAACDRSNHWLAQREGYLRMLVEELLEWRDLKLAVSLAALAGRPGLRVRCAGCDEEVINGRQVYVGDTAYCRSCVGESYLDRAGPLAIPPQPCDRLRHAAAATGSPTCC